MEENLSSSVNVSKEIDDSNVAAEIGMLKKTDSDHITVGLLYYKTD